MQSENMSGFRIGFGYDLHQLVKGRPLILGGVEIPFNKGLMGHSDADCLTHAIADAILGAAGLRDIGYHFPDTDPQHKDINSLVILRQAVTEIRKLGYSIGNIDATLIAEQPKIGPYIDSMKEKLAEAMEIAIGDIGIKATTNEKMDSIGRGEAMATHAVALITEI